MATKRIYVVTVSDIGSDSVTKVIVRATNQARAERHVIDQILMVKAAVAGQDELLGVKPEDVVEAKEE